MNNFLCILLFLVFTVSVTAQSYEDKRCKCICPSTSSVINNTLDTSETDRILIIDYVPPNKCNCDSVILPKVGDLHGKEKEYCPRCECKNETRNTTIVKVVVTIVIWITSLLVIYMLFLICLEPLLNKRMKTSYQEHENEDEESTPSPSNFHPLGVSGNVLIRVGHQQDKWKRQVKEQRKNIYDRHTMLN